MQCHVLHPLVRRNEMEALVSALETLRNHSKIHDASGKPKHDVLLRMLGQKTEHVRWFRLRMPQTLKNGR